MGGQVTVIKNNTFRKNANSLLNVPLSRVRDFHASFKSICDNFSMDLAEFEHIFGLSESAFVIWDTDNNGLIDSLELFSGIALFSDTKFEDKIRFLFDLFDFNELDSLALVDIEFMIYCCLSATQKIFSISQEEINTTDINDFVNKTFQGEVRITVVKLLEKAKESDIISQFFTIIQADQVDKETQINKQEKTFSKLQANQLRTNNNVKEQQ